MSKKKSRPGSATFSGSPTESMHSEPSTDVIVTDKRRRLPAGDDWRPSTRLKIVISSFISLHFLGLLVAWLGNASPSFLLGEIQRWLAPIHVSTGQDYIMLPIDLAHASEMESPVVLQVRYSSKAEWESISIPSVQFGAVQRSLPEVLPVDYSTRYSRWYNLSRLIAWIAIEQPESEVVPAFVLQCLRNVNSRDNATEQAIAEVRLFQPHALTYDQAAIVMGGQAELVANNLTGMTLYAAHVLAEDNGELRLVPQEESRRNAAPRNPADPLGSAPSERPLP